MKKLLIMVVLIFAFFYSNSEAATADEHKAKNLELRKDYITENQHSIYLSVEEKEYFKDELAFHSEIAPYVKEGRTYIPIALFAELFSTKVDWFLADHSFLMMWKGSALKVSLEESKIYYQGKEMDETFADIDEEKGVALPLVDLLKIMEVPYQWVADTSSVFIYEINKNILEEIESNTPKTTEADVLASLKKKLEEEAGQEEDLAVHSMLEIAKSRLGSPYVMGAAGPNRFDCSGFVHWVYTKAGIRQYQRGSSQSLYAMCRPISQEELQVGDLLFYTRTYAARVPITHVAIYMGNGQMIHAAGNRVQITSVFSPYWLRHFYGYGRMK